MSLDDLIQSRRNESKERKRESVKAGITKTKKTPTKADAIVGKGKAKRTAAQANRRGIVSSEKPTSMQVEKETYRQQRKTQGPGRFPREAKTSQSHSEADVRSKARALQNNKRQGGSAGTDNPRPPTKKALNAAVRAMNDAGYSVPRGMQMVVSFAPAPNNQGGRGNAGRGGRGGGGRGRGRSRGR